MRTVPVNQSAGPFPEGCVPILLMSMVSVFVREFVFCERAAGVEPVEKGNHGDLARGSQETAAGKDHDAASFSVHALAARARCRVRHSPGEVSSQRWKARKKEFASS